MVARTLLLVVAALVATEAAKAAKEATREPLSPSDIVYGTGSLIHEGFSAAYAAAEGLVTKHVQPLGLHTQAQDLYKTHVGDDVIKSTCSKVGCDAKDVQAKLDQAHATVQQVKAQAYEHGNTASTHLNGFAHTFVEKFETFVPSKKGSIRRTFLDVILVTLYFAFVAWIVIRITLFGVKKALSIFCCFFCCGCCRSRSAPKKGKNAAKKGADAKATPKQAPAAKKSPGKK